MIDIINTMLQKDCSGGWVVLLTQQEAETLIETLKSIKDTNTTFAFPIPGDYKKLELSSMDGKYTFIVDVNRKGSINLSKKCTYQGRYQKDTILLRLDIGGPDHTNPDGETICGSHLHVYKEGFGDKVAIALPPEITGSDDLFQTLIDFLIYFKTDNAKQLEIEEVI